MSFTASTMIETLARLRLVLEAASAASGVAITIDDVRLADLAPSERARLLRLADADFRRVLAGPAPMRFERAP